MCPVENTPSLPERKLQEGSEVETSETETLAQSPSSQPHRNSRWEPGADEVKALSPSVEDQKPESTETEVPSPKEPEHLRTLSPLTEEPVIEPSSPPPEEPEKPKPAVVTKKESHSRISASKDNADCPPVTEQPNTCEDQCLTPVSTQVRPALPCWQIIVTSWLCSFTVQSFTAVHLHHCRVKMIRGLNVKASPHASLKLKFTDVQIIHKCSV